MPYYRHYDSKKMLEMYVEDSRQRGWHEPSGKRGFSCLIVAVMVWGFISVMPRVVLRCFCTEPVLALVIDGYQYVEHVEKQVQFYRYEYNGEEYKVRLRTRSFDRNVRSGVRTELYIDPENPQIYYNRKSGDSGLLIVVLIWAALAGIFIIALITPTFRRD